MSEELMQPHSEAEHEQRQPESAAPVEESLAPQPPDVEESADDLLEMLLGSWEPVDEAPAVIDTPEFSPEAEALPEAEAEPQPLYAVADTDAVASPEAFEAIETPSLEIASEPAEPIADTAEDYVFIRSESGRTMEVPDLLDDVVSNAPSLNFLFDDEDDLSAVYAQQASTEAEPEVEATVVTPVADEPATTPVEEAPRIVETAVDEIEVVAVEAEPAIAESAAEPVAEILEAAEVEAAPAEISEEPALALSPEIAETPEFEAVPVMVDAEAAETVEEIQAPVEPLEEDWQSLFLANVPVELPEADEPALVAEALAPIEQESTEPTAEAAAGETPVEETAELPDFEEIEWPDEDTLSAALMASLEAAPEESAAVPETLAETGAEEFEPVEMPDFNAFPGVGGLDALSAAIEEEEAAYVTPAGAEDPVEEFELPDLLSAAYFQPDPEQQEAAYVSAQAPAAGMLQANGAGLLDDLIASIDLEIAEAPLAMTARQLQQRERSQATRHVVFTIGESRFSLPMSQVMETERLPRVTSVPNVPDFIQGVINLRGDIIPLLDTSAILSLGEWKRASKASMLVVRNPLDQQVMALVVDEVNGLTDLYSEDIAPAASSPHPGMADILTGVGEYRERPLSLLNLQAFFVTVQALEPAAV